MIQNIRRTVDLRRLVPEVSFLRQYFGHDPFSHLTLDELYQFQLSVERHLGFGRRAGTAFVRKGNVRVALQQARQDLQDDLTNEGVSHDSARAQVEQVYDLVDLGQLFARAFGLTQSTGIDCLRYGSQGLDLRCENLGTGAEGNWLTVGPGAEYTLIAAMMHAHGARKDRRSFNFSTPIQVYGDLNWFEASGIAARLSDSAPLHHDMDFATFARFGFKCK